MEDDLVHQWWKHGHLVVEGRNKYKKHNVIILCN